MKMGPWELLCFAAKPWIMSDSCLLLPSQWNPVYPGLVMSYLKKSYPSVLTFDDICFIFRHRPPTSTIIHNHLAKALELQDSTERA